LLQLKISNKNSPEWMALPKMSNLPEAMVGCGQIVVYPGAPGISPCQREPPQLNILNFSWTFLIEGIQHHPKATASHAARHAFGIIKDLYLRVTETSR
jgi:hypothetical protein